ncbi:MAG: MFS transporter [Chloroflexota bacterium]|nr:MAG: MFS transporter [Chloroflexota bacterium]
MRLFYGWPLVTALGLTTVVSYGTTAYLYGVILLPMAAETGWDRASLSLPFAISMVLAGLVGLPIGRLVDRRGARLVMAAGSAISGLALLAVSRSGALWHLYVLWGGAIGLGMAMTFYPVSMVVVAHWFHRRRGAAYGVLTLLGGFASVIFIPLAGVLIPMIGWRDTVAILGIVQLLVPLPLHAFLVRRHPEDLGLHPDGAEPGDEVAPVPLSGATLRQALREPAFWFITVAATIEQAAAMIVWSHGIAFIVSRGFDSVLAAAIAGLVGAVSLPGRLIFNLLSDRISARHMLGYCLVVQGIGITMLAAATDIRWLYAYAVLFGVAYGTRSPLRASVMAGFFGRRAYGAITAVQGLPVALAAGLGPLGAGALFDALGGYDLAFWLTATAFAIAGAITLVTPRPRSVVSPAGG